jgi:RNA 3'-terminal phosphate cyclase (ATP)
MLLIFMELVDIDGSFGEGGGQIVRTAVSLSGTTGQAIRISRIRAGRSKPGLSYQHIHAIKAVQKLTGARVEGLGLGSQDISFFPGKIKSGNHQIDIGTAGSVSLVLQTFLIPALFSEREVRIKIRGGTDVPMSPPVDYVKRVFLKTLSRMGLRADFEFKRRGHYPKGGGLIDLKVYRSKIKGFQLDYRGDLVGIHGLSHCTSLPSHIAERQRDSALSFLEEKNFHGADIKTEVSTGLGEGTGIVLWAEFTNSVMGSSSLGKRGKRAEKVGEEAAALLCNEISSGAVVDSHLGDQLIPYIALAKGNSSIVCKLTSHTKTNIYTTEKILGRKFWTIPLEDGLVEIRAKNLK